VFLVTLVAGVAMTNQLHKWAHVPTVPRLVAAAQRRGIVLSKEHHAIHHSGNNDRNFCITWGVVDVVLNRLVGSGQRQANAGVDTAAGAVGEGHFSAAGGGELLNDRQSKS
jgi:ubiquitin-conjugating enzyme E2 variant